MAKKAYVGVNGKARNVPKIYVGVNGKARNVIKGYIGVNGVARLFFESKVPFIFGYKTGTSGSKTMSFSSIPFEPVFAMAVSRYSDGYNMGFYTSVPATSMKFLEESGTISVSQDSRATATFSNDVLNITASRNALKFSAKSYYYIIANENYLNGQQYINTTNQISINVGIGKKIKAMIIFLDQGSSYIGKSIFAYANDTLYLVDQYEDNGYYYYRDGGTVSISYSYSNGNIIIDYPTRKWSEGTIYYCIAFE